MHVFPSFGIGGAQIRFCQLAIAHGDRYRHTVVALDGVLDMAQNIPSAVAIRCVVPSFDKRAGLRNLPLIRSALKQANPDVLVTYNWGAIEWCFANRWLPVARHIHIEDGFGPEEKERQLMRRVLFRRVALSGHHTHIILPSHQLERIALGRWRLPKRSILYIPNGVDCARFARNPATPRTYANSVVIGTVATLRREKNLARLIRAFAAVAEKKPSESLRLIIVGDGPERPALEAAATATGRSSQIVFTGARTDPESMLAEMDIFALSSDTEQMPISVLEAMAAELPIVSVAVGDIVDMVASENRRYVVPRDDEKEFSDSLCILVEDAQLRAQLGRANRSAAITRFDHALMVARYAEQFG
jgi:glycosyltransferase involved in cell wall biosynthesis